ncbi:hypothetical protein [Aquabacterium sp. A08]|uniref:hypothetical protein n=1 Tax=Aquabacterium sp. A08 TaxID=2718532 RepID=UPI001422A388|nr:hypothetical protein [Aquabacterium sp. A08]NIC40468.1 hypothetical protein [Aquabacterium sp. A08]
MPALRTFTTAAALAAAALLLTACGEKPQGMGGIKSDSPPSTGVGASQYAAPGWKAGDANGWQQQLRARAQYGQNEYSRATAAQ